MGSIQDDRERGVRVEPRSPSIAELRGAEFLRPGSLNRCSGVKKSPTNLPRLGEGGNWICVGGETLEKKTRHQSSMNGSGPFACWGKERAGPVRPEHSRRTAEARAQKGWRGNASRPSRMDRGTVESPP